MNRSQFIACALFSTVTLVNPLSAGAQTFEVSKFSIGGDGSHDYIVAEPGSHRVFVSRSTHFMVLDGTTGEIIGDIPDTPGVHGVALVPAWHHGFTTNGGDSTVTMFDLETLRPIRRIPVDVGGLDGIMYAPSIDRVILTNHSKPVGTAVAIDPGSGEITGTAELEDTEPEGAAIDSKGRLFVNNEGTSTIQVIDAATMKALESWPLAPCEGPTGIVYDEVADRIVSGCSHTSVVVDAHKGEVVATIPNGNGVDGVGWDPSEKLLYIPAGRDGIVTVAHQDSPDDYSVVATVKTMVGARTISVDRDRHVAYVFTPEYGPPPPPPPGQKGPLLNARGFPVRGPVVGAWLFVISH